MINNNLIGDIRIGTYLFSGVPKIFVIVFCLTNMKYEISLPVNVTEPVHAVESAVTYTFLAGLHEFDDNLEKI